MVQSKATPIQLVGGHLDDPPEYAHPIIFAIGLASMNWARLEQHLQALLISVNKPNFAAHPYSVTPNTSFRRKVALFKTWFCDDPRFAAYRDRASRLAKSFMEASVDRNLLLHSNLQRFRPGPPAVMIAANIRLKGENLIQSRVELTEERIVGFAIDVRALNRGLRSISVEVMTETFLRSLERH